MTVTANSEVDIEFESEMDFCKGMSMTMSMDGFQSALFSKGHPADCITFFFPEWELDRPGKFVGAMIATFMVAVVSEGITYLQPHVRNDYLAGKPKHRRKTIMTLMYGFQQLLGWLLMLIAMTFSIELFASVILGLFIGRLLFPSEPLTTSRNNPIKAQRSSADITRDMSLRGEKQPLLSFPRSSISSNGSSESAIRRRRR
mmetsp:Transcript_663/g.1575  ORF Transcript_663/g.1575 Transcript_663/m.1575 type:complete len:201 (+) Transcript_663:134-736(+)